MDSLQAIAKAMREGDTDAMALATVMKTEGSAYRRAGARMLVLGEAARIGSVSGGCLEADVVERAKRVLATGEPEYVFYDAREPAAAMHLNLGCEGAAGILIEPARTAAEMIQYLDACGASRVTAMLATVYQAPGALAREIGRRAYLQPDGRAASGIRDAALDTAVLADLRRVRHPRQQAAYDLPGGAASALIERIPPPIALLILGAGQDAMPVARLAAVLGWQVTVADPRAALLTDERFPDSRHVVATVDELARRLEAARTADGAALSEREGGAGRRLDLDARAAVVMMTHNYTWDLTLLQPLMPSPAAYIGLLGPLGRTRRLLAELGGSGPQPGQLARLYNPIGLDIGSETPEEIALAIVAEIQAVMAGTAGGSLREAARR